MGDFPLTFRVGRKPCPFGIVGTKVQNIMEKNKSTHGGYRAGAGRKPTGKKKITATLNFSQEIIDHLRTKGRKQSEYIEQLIKKDMERAAIDPITMEELRRLLVDPEPSDATTWLDLLDDYYELIKDFQTLQFIVRFMIR